MKTTRIPLTNSPARLATHGKSRHWICSNWKITFLTSWKLSSYHPQHPAIPLHCWTQSSPCNAQCVTGRYGCLDGTIPTSAHPLGKILTANPPPFSNIYPRWGKPLIGALGPQYTAKDFSLFPKPYRFLYVTSSPRFLQSNRQVRTQPTEQLTSKNRWCRLYQAIMGWNWECVFGKIWTMASVETAYPL